MRAEVNETKLYLMLFSVSSGSGGFKPQVALTTYRLLLKITSWRILTFRRALPTCYTFSPYKSLGDDSIVIR